MPSAEKRVRVERGLYKTGAFYHACATPPGSRSATWKALGAVNLMEARRLRDKFCAAVEAALAPPASAPRRTFGDRADASLAEQKVRMDVGEMSRARSRATSWRCDGMSSHGSPPGRIRDRSIGLRDMSTGARSGWQARRAIPAPPA